MRRLGDFACAPCASGDVEKGSMSVVGSGKFVGVFLEIPAERQIG